ncbi:MAG: hypothetical protein NZ602_14640 [Thermoguttaceae bacterium]|nr:hypothetical protein [Thermoguttaceae bacterium]MDW8036536.1 hypothetical protein [Thermoguttaceae bacterium]
MELIEQILQKSFHSTSKSSLSIGIVTSTLLIGGAERWVIDLARIVKQSSFEYVALSTETLEGHPNFLREAIPYAAVVGGQSGIEGLFKRCNTIIYWNDLFLPPENRGILVGHSEREWTRKKS